MNSYFDAALEIARQLIELDSAEEHHKAQGQWKKGKKAYDALLEDFNVVRQEFIESVLQTPEGHATAVAETEAQIQNLKDIADPSWTPVIEYLEANLLPNLRKEARRSPRTRKALKALPVAVGAACVVAYFGTAVLYRTAPSDPIETRPGIEQRAASFAKVIRYDDWADTKVRRGGWVKGILLWPIEPNEQEIAGGADFAGIGLEAANFVAKQHGCHAPYSDGSDKLTDEELDYLTRLAEKVGSDETKWTAPPLLTVVEAARAVGGC